MNCFAGVDVGGARKGFHACVIESSSVRAGPERITEAAAVVEWLRPHSPAVIAIDSPRSSAKPGQTARDAERQFAKAKICGIRWTPEEAKLEGNPYYEWIARGLDLYDALAGFKGNLIEVFPTASWSQWLGPRGSETRARWTSKGLELLGLDGLPRRRMNQDDRDAIAAALTAWQYRAGKCEEFGEIIVPRRGCLPR